MGILHMTIRWASVAGLTLLVSAVAASARAQGQSPTPIADITLEQLATVEVNTVFGASRYLQRVTDAPSAVTIVTHEEIERFGYQTLADVLRGVRGFYVSNDRNYTYLGVRGFSRPGDYNSRVLVMINGHRLNETVYDLTYFGNEFPLSIELIDRVEVVRGPGSSLYGTSAFFAVINVITKKAAAIPSLRASVMGGSLKTGAVDLSYGREMSQGTELVAGGSGFGTEGNATFPVPGLGVAHDMDTESAWTAFGSVSHGPWSVSGLRSSRDKRIPTGAFGIVLDDRRSQTNDTRMFVDLVYDGQMRETGVMWRTAYDYAGYDGTYVYPADQGGVLSDASRADWWSTDVMFTRRVKQRHFLTGGGEYRNNFRQDQIAAYPEAPSVDIRKSSQVGAIFAQDEITVAKRLSVTAGIRQDWHSASQGSTNVRLAAIVKPIAEASLKVLYGSAFRAPNPYELVLLSESRRVVARAHQDDGNHLGAVRATPVPDVGVRLPLSRARSHLAGAGSDIAWRFHLRQHRSGRGDWRRVRSRRRVAWRCAHADQLHVPERAQPSGSRALEQLSAPSVSRASDGADRATPALLRRRGHLQR